MAPRRIPLPALLAAGAVAVILLGVLVVSFVSMRKDAGRELCRGNLAILYMAIRSGELLDSPLWDAPGTGRAFLASQDKWPTRQHRPLDLCCPVKGTRAEIDYRGPALPIRKLRKDDPLASDRPGNHGAGKGGNVLLKSGEVYEVPEAHALWAEAARTTSD